jgi:dihydrofolate reductase
MSAPTRRVVGNIALTLDGRIAGPGGEYDMRFVLPHASSDGVEAHMDRVYDATSTVLLGRKNYEGFRGYWGPVADDETAGEHDRKFARWFTDVEKVVLSTTLDDAAWTNARVTDAPVAAVIDELRSQPGADITVLASASVIVALLEADLLDRLSITLVPEILGGGRRLFDDGLPESSWRASEASVSSSGAITTFFDRAR